jgi:hypothetical protein
MRRGASHAAIAIGIAAVGACGMRIEGTYVGGDASFLDSLTFRSGGEVDVTFLGMTKRGTYAVDGREVRVMVGGESHVFTIDDEGCLAGGGPLGGYCRQAGARPPAAPGDLDGAYVASIAGGSIALEFGDERTVRMTTIDPDGARESSDATYVLAGERVTIAGPDGEQLDLTRRDDALEGAMGDLTIRFVRR